MRSFITVVLLLTCSFASMGQKTVYVNTDNLVMRDRPEREYLVFAILHAPCPLVVEKYEDGYKNNKSVTDRFYQVSMSWEDNNGIHHYMGGWVPKKFVVLNLADITVKGLDTRSQVPPIAIALTTLVESDDYPHRFNAALFQAPVYKGAEPQLKRVYHKGPRGGCYYRGARGKKIYVDKKLCK